MANNFLSRWSQRKLEEQSEQQAKPEEEAVLVDEESVDLPFADEQSSAHGNISDNQDQKPETDIDSEDGELSISQLLANTEVDKAVKKAALRKLFMQPEFNVVDGLNDYDHDYSAVKPLATDVAETLRGWVKDVEENLEQHEELEESAVVASHETTVQIDEGEQNDLETIESDQPQKDDDPSNVQPS
ncbi:DUF3306 domain-containing protein [Vibrio hangzhouensis]|uniref:DUF3306 domain-containing protein n=1 Tax=Vibrio hangzhouensis TaxID=462991 RepID=A0A1H5WD93_9VIBR|nr:DUF3306 domain-containing protein [Vibrio hangzhouensis]SEF97445.1 Protein of unknown function [Vibrio hangzhouensis]